MYIFSSLVPCLSPCAVTQRSPCKVHERVFVGSRSNQAKPPKRQFARAHMMLRIARWPAMFIAVALALALIYRYGPSREAPQWRWITWGSAAAAVLWLVASA